MGMMSTSQQNLDVSGFISTSYGYFDFVLMMVQRLLCSLIVICGQDITSPHGVEETDGFSRHILRVSRNYIYLIRALRIRLSQQFNGGKSPRPEVKMHRLPYQTVRSSPRRESVTQNPEELEHSAIKGAKGCPIELTTEYARNDSTFNWSFVFHNLLEGVVGVVPDPFVNHSFAAEMEDLVDVNDDGFETAMDDEKASEVSVEMIRNPDFSPRRHRNNKKSNKVNFTEVMASPTKPKQAKLIRTETPYPKKKSSTF